MQKQNFSEALEKILQHDRRYDADAYQFVRESLDYTLKMLKKAEPGRPRHVSGQELLEGIRQYALDQFGPLTKTVLDHWGVHRCEDFGEIVFNLVNEGVLGRSEQDKREDFQSGYDFNDAFVRPYEAPAKPPARRAAVRTKTDTGRLPENAPPQPGKN